MFKRMNRFVKNLESNIGKKLLHDSLIMEGHVDIVNGDKIIHGRNSIVDQGLAGIVNLLSGQSTHSATSYSLPSFVFSGSPPNPFNGFMVIGSDTTHGTSNGTTSLSTPIGTAPGTKPNSQSGLNSGGAGIWQVQWTSTWNAGVLPAVTLGEVGLYLYFNPALQSFQSVAQNSSNLFSRMSSADGKFSPFTINNTVPLSVSWAFRLTYSV